MEWYFSTQQMYCASYLQWYCQIPISKNHDLFLTLPLTKWWELGESFSLPLCFECRLSYLPGSLWNRENLVTFFNGSFFLDSWGSEKIQQASHKFTYPQNLPSNDYFLLPNRSISSKLCWCNSTSTVCVAAQYLMHSSCQESSWALSFSLCLHSFLTIGILKVERVSLGSTGRLCLWSFHCSI